MKPGTGAEMNRRLSKFVGHTIWYMRGDKIEKPIALRSVDSQDKLTIAARLHFGLNAKTACEVFYHRRVLIFSEAIRA